MKIIRRTWSLLRTTSRVFLLIYAVFCYHRPCVRLIFCIFERRTQRGCRLLVLDTSGDPGIAISHSCDNGNHPIRIHGLVSMHSAFSVGEIEQVIAYEGRTTIQKLVGNASYSSDDILQSLGSFHILAVLQGLDDPTATRTWGCSVDQTDFRG